MLSRATTKLLRFLARTALVAIVVCAMLTFLTGLWHLPKPSITFKPSRIRFDREDMCTREDTMLFQHYSLESEDQILAKMGSRSAASLGEPAVKAAILEKQSSELLLAQQDNYKRIKYADPQLTPWEHNPSFSDYPRITYVNGHRGCNENMHAAMSKLKLNFKVFDPRQVSEYGMGEKHARRLVSFGFINKLCDASDVIVIADTMPDGRAILVSLTAVQEKLRCKSQIVVELTNRFDWLVYDSEKYYKMLKRLIEKPPPNLHWTQNNPFEEVYFKMRVGVSPKKMRLLRSMGGVNVRYDDNNNTAAIETPEMAERLALIKDLQETYKPKIGDVLDYLCMPHAKLPKKYGGPEALLKYKGFIEFPYQVSVMKFYENVANGVPQVIPSARLMKGVVQSNNHHYFDCWLAALEEGSLMLSNPDRFLKEKKKDIGFHGVDRSYNASWIELSDFYSTEFQPFVYYFDSFRELGDLINKPASQFDVKNVRVEGPKFYEKVRQQTLTTWETLFHEINFTHVRLK